MTTKPRPPVETTPPSLHVELKPLVGGGVLATLKLMPIERRRGVTASELEAGLRELAVQLRIWCFPRMREAGASVPLEKVHRPARQAVHVHTLEPAEFEGEAL